MTGTLAQALRVGGSLAFVLGLMWVLARVLRGRAGGRAGGLLEVVARQQLGRSAAVTVVRVGERTLVLGVTDNQVSLLADATPEAVPGAVIEGAADTAANVKNAPVAVEGEVVQTRILDPAPACGDPGPAAGPLAGSVLSPSTWQATMAFLRERTVRRA
jgi:flagellar protein FliO/FliZ